MVRSNKSQRNSMLVKLLFMQWFWFQAQPFLKAFEYFWFTKYFHLFFFFCVRSVYIFITPTKVSHMHYCFLKNQWFGGCGVLYELLWDILHSKVRQGGWRCQTYHKVFHFLRWFYIFFSLSLLKHLNLCIWQSKTFVLCLQTRYNWESWSHPK